MHVDPSPLYAVLAALLAALLILWTLLPRLRARRRRRRVERTVRRAGVDYLRDVLIPDGLDGRLHVEYLMLTPRAIFVLDVREYEGAVFAGATLDSWTQMVGRRSFKFTNPLAGNRLRRTAVRALAEDVPVHGRVVFTADAWFPKGVPEGVSRLAELGRDIAAGAGEGEPSPALRAAWERLRAAAEPARTPPPVVRAPWRARFSAALLLVVGALLAWHYVL